MLIAAIPVLLELFTSEGCSSCPPADELVRSLRVEGAEVLVLSEHVDYWNSLGWKDPFSSAQFSERQARYGERIYTPQAIVQGRYDVLGSDEAALRKAIQRAAAETRATVTLKRDGDALRIATDAQGEVLLAIVEDGLSNLVTRGENTGRTLHHDAVVRSLRKVSTGRVKLELDPAWKHPRAVVFVQGTDGVLAAAAIAL